MPNDEQPTHRPAAELIADWIVERLEAHRDKWTADHPGKEGRAPPLVCAIQGPQGSVRPLRVRGAKRMH